MRKEIWYSPDMFFNRDMLMMLERNMKVDETNKFWEDIKREGVLFDQHITHLWRKKKNAAATTTVLAAVIRTTFVIMFLSDDDGFIGETCGGRTGPSSLNGKKVSMF